MKRSIIVVLLAALVALTLAPAAMAETERTKIGNGKVYTFIADTSQSARITVMWDKRQTDLDIVAFDSAGNVVGVSIGAADGLEVLEFGVVGGVIYDVALLKFAGPNTKFQANFSTAGSELVSRPNGGNFGYVGDLNALAAADAHFASIQEKAEAALAFKAANR